MASELKIDVRRKKILEILNRDGVVKVTQLSDLLGATTVTIRADLGALEREGFLQRTTGGAILTIKNTYKTDTVQHRQVNFSLKKAIAEKTASLIPDGSTLIINSGTTTYLCAIELKKRKNLNIVTNSLEVALELGGLPSFKVILLGGEVNSHYGFSYGSDTLEQLQQYKAEYALLSMDGISENFGLTTHHAEEAIIDRSMIKRSRNVIIVADSTKYEHEGFSFVADISAVTTWITDASIDPSTIDRMRTSNINIVLA